MKGQHITVAALAFLLFKMTACHDSVPVQERSVPVGADRDAHGCIASAGYRWCEREKACARPWELAAQRGIPNTPEGFSQYCNGV